MNTIETVRIDDEIYHQRHGVAIVAHGSLRKQVVIRGRIHCFRIANVRSIEIEDQITESRQW
jgi:hypothetical protein